MLEKCGRLDLTVFHLILKFVMRIDLQLKSLSGRHVCQSRMSYFGYVAEDRTKWDKGR